MQRGELREYVRANERAMANERLRDCALEDVKRRAIEIVDGVALERSDAGHDAN